MYYIYFIVVVEFVIGVCLGRSGGEIDCTAHIF